MNNDELEDRLRALETLNRTLIRRLVHIGAMNRKDVEAIFDSMVDMATGDPRHEYQAERLKALIEGESGTEETREAERRWRHEQRKDLYGYTGPML